MPFDMKKLLAESIYERCNAYEEILPQLLKTTSENLIAHSTQMKDSSKNKKREIVANVSMLKQ
jgi:hypothetical protein